MNLINLKTDCDFLELSPENPITDFDCGDSDLNDFFNRDALLFQSERLGQTYYHCLKKTRKIVCAFSLSADSLKAALLPGSRIKKVRVDTSRKDITVVSCASYRKVGRFGRFFRKGYWFSNDGRYQNLLRFPILSSGTFSCGRRIQQRYSPVVLSEKQIFFFVFVRTTGNRKS